MVRNIRRHRMAIRLGHKLRMVVRRQQLGRLTMGRTRRPTRLDWQRWLGTLRSRPRPRLGPMGERQQRLVDKRPMDKLVGNWRLSGFHLVGLDERSVGH